ncbi:MAG: TPM domain-containing protein [Candidatus Brocadiaceae bacterium]|nr:TPM domain-containing protein [Candidatus Brocadiaceae bacterium]
MDRRYLLFAALIFFLCLCALTSAQDLPVPERYVVDQASIINDSIEQPLNGYLQELEQKTGAQMVVLTINSTGAVPIEMYAIELATKWKLGQEGKDNGALIVVAKDDRAYRIEVGYGLEGILPDSFCGTVGRQYFVPYFRKGQFGEGIFQAVVIMTHRVAEESGVKITGMPSLAKIKKQSRKSPFSSLLFLFFILPMLFGGGMYRRRSLLPFYFWGGFGGSRGHSSRGSSGFGGFGSFGGGMGGSFGGGGASGSW